jgi:hypothetical protein
MKLHPRVPITQELILGAILIWRAFHRDVPEQQAEGESPVAAVTLLARRLELSLEYVPDHSHRDFIEKVLADVRSVLDSSEFILADPR